MASVLNFAKRSARFLRRHLNPPQNDFPIDAWTQQKEYAAWFEAHRATPQQLEDQRRLSGDIADAPLFSFIVPLYKTPTEYLHTMADSVLAQTYPKLELVLVNASPENVELCDEVDAYARRDTRVKVVTLDANYGITENTNRGIEASAGEFCCFLDHDDFVEPDVLFEYVKALRENPAIDVLYCDEDLVVRENGVFVPRHPLFKPDYSPELLLCKNYIIHLMTVRRTLIDAMPVRDSRYDGAQDYNMVLFATLHARAVRHIAKVLYHWRISSASTAANPDAKPYSQKAYRRSAWNRLERVAPEGRIVSTGIVNIHNLWFSQPADQSVSVIVDCVGGTSDVALFLEFFRQNNSFKSCEIVLVASEGLDVSADVFSDLCICVVEVAQGTGVFARLNAGARTATGDYLVFADAGSYFITPEPLEQLVGLCALEGVGVTSPKTLYANGANRMFGMAVTDEGIIPLYRGYPDDFPAYQCNLRAFQNVSAAGVEGMCVSRAQFNELDGFDEMYEGEIGAADFCHRVIAAGSRVVTTPTVKLQTAATCPERRYELATYPPEPTQEDLTRFDIKWPSVRAAGDPYFNRNLDQRSGYFQVAGSSDT